MKIFAMFLVSMVCIFSGRAHAEVPQRIVSLGTYVTESLYDLGAAERVVGVTTFCRIPPESADKERVSSIVAVNLEAVVALNPDLIIATPLTDRKAVQALQRLGLTVEELPQVKNFEEICAQFIHIGTLIGAAAQAQEIVRQQEGALAAMRIVPGEAAPLKVFAQVGTKPLFTMNKSFFMNDLIERAGAVNIARDARAGIYSRERVLAHDPDVIIIATMGTEARADAYGWSQYPELAAVKHERVYIVDAYDFCSPTPKNFVAAFAQLRGLLQNEGAGHENISAD